MRLHELLSVLDPLRVEGPVDLDVHAVSRDSRHVDAHTAFVAIRGAAVDGHRFVPGLRCAAVVVEQWPEGEVEATVVQVADTRLALARLAAALNGDPSRTLPVIGVTGTNGKTTVTALVEGALSQLGWRVGRIGTTGTQVAGIQRDTGFTTPEAPELQSLLAQMVQVGARAAVMEVSSIGLSQRRVDGVRYHTAVFTNLSRDHLDFHGTMEAYASAKARLFSEALLREAGGRPRALLCGEDPAWASMAPPADHWRYGAGDFELSVRDEVLEASGSRAHLTTPVGEGTVATTLPGRFNLLNAVAAVGVLLTLDVPLPAALSAVAAAPGPRGRMSRVPGDGPTVLVDYAHTPDALASVLASLRPLTGGHLWVVFGCGGDRDAGKRPLMGQAALAADRVVVTSDNPRSEDPQSIVDAVLSGMSTAPDLVELDRAAAIRWAITQASRGDVVLIAGKGHETTQEIAGTKHPFDDFEHARGALREGTWS